jgi:multimeric flavodoxin WrbA
MYVIAINGSPRKNGNTATLLNKALEGASSQGATTELINLYDLNFKGCISCFACKLKGGKSYGKCGYKDELTPVLEKVGSADAVILGSPIYFGEVTGEMRSLIERLVFQYLVYDKNYSSLNDKRKPIGLIYTMNASENILKEIEYDRIISRYEDYFEKFMGPTESLLATDTYQFSDYSKYVATAFDEAAKAKRRQEVFPKDCQKAFEMGTRFASNTLE